MTTSTVADAQSLTSLLRQTSITDDEEILKAANAVLKKAKNDLQALHARTVALLKLDRFDEALHTFEDAGTALKNIAPLEWAYALYKNGKLSEARDVVAQSSGRGMKHLGAQVAYRAEDFSRAAEIYKDLSREQSTIDTLSDLRINSLATDAQLILAGHEQLVPKIKPDRDDLEACDTVFNIGCAYIGRGELKQAEFFLKRAKDLCNASDLSEAEKRSDMFALTVQHIYVLCRLEKLDEAEKLCSTLDISDSLDQTTRHIAQNNILCASRSEKNPFLAQRKFQCTSNHDRIDRPFKFQDFWLSYNAKVLDLHAGKFNSLVEKSSSKSKENLLSTAPETIHNSIFNAAACSKNEASKAALKEILPLLEQRPNDVGLMLTIVQLYVLTKNPAAAMHLLEAFLKRLEFSSNSKDLDVRFAPGLVALATTLFTDQGRGEHTKIELRKAATYWRDKSKEGPNPSSLLNAAGAALLSNFPHNDPSTAHTYFAAAHASDPLNPITKAGLVGSSTMDSPQLQELLARLPTVAELTSGIDAAALETNGIARLPDMVTSDSIGSKKRGTAGRLDAPKAKKPRKSRLPKDYDPEKKPDPERWLPIRDRSTWRPSRKKGKGKSAMNTGTQGGTGIDETRTASPAAAQVVKAKGKRKGKK